MLHLALPGPTELYVILAVVLLIFGSRKLPELARAMGSSINQFKRGLKDSPELLEEEKGGSGSEKGESERDTR